MLNAGARAAAASVVVALIAVFSFVGAATPAAADDTNLGWLRLDPPTGRTDIGITSLTEGPCPDGEAAVVAVSGPGVPTTGDIGYIVGNVAITALQPTRTGQLYLPLSSTLKDWFARNAVGLVPNGTYTLTLTCRDYLRKSLTYGVYTGQVAIAKDGTYRAVGEAAKPFDVQPASDGLDDPGSAPSQLASPPATVGGGTSVPPTPGASQPPAPSGVASSRGSSAAGVAPSGSPVAAPASTDSGSGIRTGLLLLGAAVLAAGAIIGLRNRGGATPEDGAHTPARDSVDAH